MTGCRRCLLPAGYPGADLDSGRVCAFCREGKHSDSGDEDVRRERLRDLEKTLKDSGGSGAYDAVVCLSGGKDSLYLLHVLKEQYRLRVLAFTVDNNIPAIAWDNIHRAVKKLDVDHVTYRPQNDLYRRLFGYLLKNQEARGAVYTVSYVYAPLFEGEALKLAYEREIPLVLAGYSPGQPEPERMEYEFSRDLICRTDWTPPHLRDCGKFSDAELRCFWNPYRYGADARFPRYLAPLHVWEYDQSEIMRKVVQWGLVAGRRRANPIVTNYPINWLLMYSDLKHFGYNPYNPEFSALIRQGKASLRRWRILLPIVNFMIRHKIWLAREIKKSLEWLEMKEDELRINLPRGAYDPVVGAGG